MARIVFWFVAASLTFQTVAGIIYSNDEVVETTVEEPAIVEEVVEIKTRYSESKGIRYRIHVNNWMEVCIQSLSKKHRIPYRDLEKQFVDSGTYKDRAVRYSNKMIEEMKYESSYGRYVQERLARQVFNNCRGFGLPTQVASN